jgi:DNA polymerase
MNKKELIGFYKSRVNFIPQKENIDFTLVMDPYLDEKRDNPIMIIGEAPGSEEVKQRAPFVGKAGENLNFLISISGLDRKKDFLITNAFPFRTFEGNKNRTPKVDELKECAKLLKREIELVKPSLIILLGNSAIKAFSYLCKDVKKLKKCGFYRVCNYNIGVCYHPSPIAFNRKEIKESLIEFFKRLKDG